MPVGFNIRSSTAEDMPLIRDVLGVDDARFYEEHLGRRGTVLSAWWDDEFLAAVWVSLEPADEWIIRRLLKNVPLLYRLRVRDDRRGEGIGTKLVKAAQAYLWEAGRKRVSVGIDHKGKSVKDFYRHLGYRQWLFGLPVPTFEVAYTADGQRVLRRDRCRMLVMRLKPSSSPSPESTQTN